MKHTFGAIVSVLLLAGAVSCGAKLPPAVAGPPKYPEFVFPALVPPDPRMANLATLHQTGWQFLEAGDEAAAERTFAAVLKKSAAFYPSDAALGYVELARKNYAQALTHFEHVLNERAAYAPALVGRGQTLLALSRDAEALASFEAALRADPTLPDIGTRVEVLRARAAQENVASARRAAQAGRLDEAVQAYQQAITASPESGFLFRDLADVEVKQGKTDQALGHYKTSIQLDPSDVSSRIHAAEIMESTGDIEGATAMYTEANRLEPTPDLSRRLAALAERAAYLRLPAEYRALPDQAAITRGDLAAVIGIRLEPLLAEAATQVELLTDVRNFWAERWIMAVANAGVMDAFENHTFLPRTEIRRAELAQAVSRVLKLIAVRQPALLKEWQGRQAKMSDVGVSNLNYADVSLAVSSGVLLLAEDGTFQLSRPVSGAEAIDAVTRLEQIYKSAK
jgi:tetratricopeptide (TPR) repeat protein